MSDDGSKTPAGHVEETKMYRKPTLGQKLKAHYRRFWWVHAILLVALILLIVLLIVFVGAPRIAQDGINKSTLEIQSQIISNPTPNSFHLEQTAIIGNHFRYHPRLDAFNASLSVDAPVVRPFAYIELPAIHATNSATSYVNETVQIANMEEFVNYNTLVMLSEEVRLAVRGRTGLHEMKYPKTMVNYQKIAQMKGLNHLNGFNVSDFDIKLRAEPDGTNMLGTVVIPNPTVMTIEMGNVTFNNYVQGDFIGISTLSNLVLRPGNNIISMRSTINQTLVIIKVLSNFHDGLLPVDIVGNSSTYRGQRLEYFEKSLQATRQHIVLDVGSKLKELGVKIPGL